MPLREFVRDLPDSPGIYKFLNTEDKLIYVGKAKSLKKRVSSYFNKDSGHNQKTAADAKKARQRAACQAEPDQCRKLAAADRDISVAGA